MTSFDPSKSSKKNDSKKWPQFLAVSVAILIVFSTGLHVGWPAPSLPQLFSDKYPFDVTQEAGSYITIIASLGAFFGSFIGNFILDKIGRRPTIMLVAVPQILSYLSIILSYECMELLYVGRFVGGVGEGMSSTTVLLYVGEIAEPSIRGILGSMSGIAWYGGILFANVVGSYLTIRNTALTFIGVPVLFVVLFSRMPESPYYLLMKHQEYHAERVLKFLRRKSDVSEELARLKADVNRQMSESGTFKDVFTIDSNRKAFFLTVGARFFQLSTGVAAMNFYIQVLLKEATQALEPHVASSIILLVQLVVTVVSTLIIDKWGRKPLLLFSIVGCCVDLLFQTTFFFLKEHTNVDVSVLDWFPLMMMIVIIVLYSAGLGSIVSVLTCEMFSASVKAKTVCLVNGTYALMTMAMTKYYQATADGFGLTVPFSSFVVMSFAGIWFIYYHLPETKGKTLEEIQQELKGNSSEKKEKQLRNFEAVEIF